jgi:1-acyl-sn-glycerol-3-phosphate acyltransferase
LCKAASAYVVPVSINNSWKMVKFGFSLRFRKSLTFVMHKPLKVSEFDFEELIGRKCRSRRNKILIYYKMSIKTSV